MTLKMAVGDLQSNEKGSGARANTGKVSFTLVPLQLLAGVARIFMGGSMKYAPFNWSKGMNWSICMDCLFRHLFKWWYCNEEIDPESGEHHIDHAICNLLMLKHYLKTYTDGDDRPPMFTHFHDWFDDVNKPFDVESYLERNPAIREKIKNEVSN